MAPRGLRTQLSRVRNVLLLEEDEMLMEKIKLGDQGAFRVLYERYKNPLLSYAYHLLGQTALAEEVTQETFIRVYKHASTYEAKAKFTTWLWTISRNLCLDHLRKKKEHHFENDEEMDAETFATLDSPLEKREMDLIQQSEEKRLQHCLQELTPSQREALTLRTFSELSYEEIAKTLSTSLASVKSLIFRAKNALVECVKKGGEK